MTEPWWSVNPDEEIRLPAPTTIHAERVLGRLDISPELLDDPRRAGYRAEIVRDATGRAIMQTERYVYTTTVEHAAQEIPFDVVVPYRSTVTVPLPRTWWERLRRKPIRTWTRTVAGTVKATGTVRVENVAKIRWPDIRTDDFRGRPIQYVEGPRFDSARVEVYSVHPRTPIGEGPVAAGQAVESAVYIRCAHEDGGCGHHWSSHQDPAADYLSSPSMTLDNFDHVQMFGGCSITGCECRRRPPRGGTVQ